MNEEEEMDPFMEEIVDEAMEDYQAMLPAPYLEAMRQVLRDEIREDPAMMELLNAARPRVTPERSSAEEKPTVSAGQGAAKKGQQKVVPFRKRNAG